MALARIGLGSNVGDAVANVARGFDALGQLGTVTARSSLYRSAAWGVTEQADFINAAGLLRTGLGPHDLLAALKDAERELGRVATFRWGPRTIDLDILAYDDLIIDEVDLTIPHARLHERAFALAPLAEIDPAFATALARLPARDRSSVQRIRAATTRTSPSVNWDETLERVRSAAEFCASAGLTRFRIEEPDLGIVVRRSVRPSRPVPAAGAAAEPDENGATTAASGNGSVVHEEPPQRILKAEFVGIVRLSRPSVSEGSQLAEDRELAFVEALGIRNPIRSGGPGRVATVFVTDGQPVEYGQPLFAIEK